MKLVTNIRFVNTLEPISLLRVENGHLVADWKGNRLVLHLDEQERQRVIRGLSSTAAVDARST